MSVSSQPSSPPASDATGCAAGGRVLRIEAEALASLAAALDQTFEAALDLLLACRGRVVVSGMGKSGHVGRKIAATLASTGTPALFVHPAEASHGDLGMIAARDVILALSNSGETSELSDIIAYSRRFAISLIAITSRPQSSLAEQADVVLALPPAPEACPHGLAPTTSTSMMMALGDALAVALIERRGFTADDFRNLHPGGSLGRTLQRVSDLMHCGEELPLITPEVRMAEAILVMTARRFGCLGVTDAAGQLIGIVTDGDLRRHMNPGLMEATVGEVMSRTPKTIRPGALAAEALRIMNTLAITSLFVTDAGVPKGILHIHDCLRAGVA